MFPTKKDIIRDSQAVYAFILQNIACSYNEILEELRLDSTHLCIALLQLIRERQITQHFFHGYTFYTPNPVPIEHHS